jgi:hypothetical protein
MKQIAGIELLSAEAPGPETSAAITAAEPVQVCWEFWREAQQRSFHGAPAVIELGEIGEDDE